MFALENQDTKSVKLSENGLRTAGLSGFSQIAINPNTKPTVLDNQTAVGLFKTEQLHNTATQIAPIASFSKNQEGKAVNGIIRFTTKWRRSLWGLQKKPIENAELTENWPSNMPNASAD